MNIYYSTHIDDDCITLYDDEHRHCSKVMRARVGDEVYVTDGLGHLYHTRITTQERSSTELHITATTTTPRPNRHLRLAIAPTKNASRIEWMLEKAIEIGVNEIYFINTSRGVSKRVKVDRLHRIAVGAMKQSKNLRLPTLHDIQDIAEVVSHASDSTLYVAHCADVEEHLAKQLIKTSPEDITIFIGPEGDFTTQEVDLLLGAGAKEVNLGTSRLRTETAAVVGASIVATVYDAVLSRT